MNTNEGEIMENFPGQHRHIDGCHHLVGSEHEGCEFCEADGPTYSCLDAPGDEVCKGMAS